VVKIERYIFVVQVVSLYNLRYVFQQYTHTYSGFGFNDETK